ncbi:MAG: alpha/beta hydrolase [Bacteroidota bacterium]
MKNNPFSLLFWCLLLLIGACQAEPKEEKEKPLPIDPKDVVIDVQVGGVPTADGLLLSFKRVGKGAETMIVPASVYLSDDLKGIASAYTVVFYDARNRGRSTTARKAQSLEGGIQKDVADLERMRTFLKAEQFSTIGFGYYGLVVAEYAKQYPNRIKKLIQLSPFAPAPNTYDAFSDAISTEVAAAMMDLAQAKDSLSQQAYCEQWWGNQRKLYVVEQENAVRTLSTICQYPNEQPAARIAHWEQYLEPSVQNLAFAEADFENLEAEVLILHGDKDRVAPLEGAKAWEKLFPNAQLEVLEGAGHAAWMDKQGLVMGAIQQFLQE